MANVKLSLCMDMDGRSKGKIIIFILSLDLILAEQLGYELMNQCSWKAQSWTEDRNYTSCSLWRTKAENPGVCGLKGMHDKRCFSFAYNFRDKTCQCQTILDFENEVLPEIKVEDGILNYQLEGYKIRLLDFVATSSEQDQFFYNGVLTKPENAVDGDKETMFHSVKEYDNNTYPFWQVTWTGIVNVTKVSVFKRPIYGHRFSNVTVYIGTEGMLETCDTFDTHIEQLVVVFQCYRPMQGHVLKIEHKGPLLFDNERKNPYRILEMTEVEIYGF